VLLPVTLLYRLVRAAPVLTGLVAVFVMGRAFQHLPGSGGKHSAHTNRPFVGSKNFTDRSACCRAERSAPALSTTNLSIRFPNSSDDSVDANANSAATSAGSASFVSIGD
jgi:hypothetical protein